MFTLLLVLVGFTFSVSQNEPTLSKTYLQGIWVMELEESNALFMIDGDSIAYLEDGLKHYAYTISDGKLVIHFDGYNDTARVKILGWSKMAFLDAKGQIETTLIKR